MFKFTIRELLLLTVIVSLAVGWWCREAAHRAADREKDALIRRMQLVKDQDELTWRLDTLEWVLHKSGTDVEFVDENSIAITETLPGGAKRRRIESFLTDRERREWWVEKY